MQNKTALKALGIFFAAMALLTVIARAADSLLIAGVTAEMASRGALSHEATSEGTVVVLDTQMVWTLAGLRVSRVPARVGARVRAGDALVELDPESVLGKLDEAKAALNKLTNERAQLEVDKPAKKQKKPTQTYNLKIKALDIDIAQARAKVDALDALYVDGALVRAPMGGVVAVLKIEAGKETGGEALMQLANTEGGLSLTCKITRDEAKHVSVGDSAHVTPPGKTKSERARVESVSQADEKGQVEVVVALPETGFAAFMLCDVAFVRKTDGHQTVVPLSALRSDSTGDHVLVLRNKMSVLGDTQVAERVPVTVQEKDGKRAAVAGAILNSDLIITGWDKALGAGDRVRQVEA